MGRGARPPHSACRRAGVHAPALWEPKGPRTHEVSRELVHELITQLTTLTYLLRIMQRYL
jgi:hypothetical protein